MVRWASSQITRSKDWRSPLLGEVHNADGMVGRKHQLYVPCRQVTHKAVCQLPPVSVVGGMAMS